MSELLIQYSTSTAFASSIIRRLTHSRFSHVDFLLPGEGLLGVSGPDQKIGDFGGVLIRPNPPWTYHDKPKLARIRVEAQVHDATIAFARAQIGKPFDGSALWGFLSDQAAEQPVRQWRDPATWFCSEFVRSAEVKWRVSVAIGGDQGSCVSG